MAVLKDLLTEQRNPASEHIDRASTLDLLRLINWEDHKVAAAVEEELPQVAKAVDAIAERFRRGGRLFYLGAGTSGRLGVLDAAECPPTFGVSPDRVVGVIAGGEAALVCSSESSEDCRDAGEVDLRQHAFGAADCLVGISASGRTPYVLGGVGYARAVGALTVGVCSNPNGALVRQVEIPIVPLTGPEVITGSTRLKSGTAQKLVLNMISTGVMIRMGYVLGNMMVNLQLNSEKLRERGRRIVAEIAGCNEQEAARALDSAGNHVRVAVVMAKLRLDAAAARQHLAHAGDDLWKALDTEAV